jgi:hypothetical protein
LGVPGTDALTQRVVAAVAEDGHGVQRGRPVRQGVTEPVGDHAQLAPAGTVMALATGAIYDPDIGR